MPKRKLLVAFAAFASVVACNSGYNVNNLYGTATATPTATASPTANPALTTATVTVTVSGSPLPNQPVSLYASTTSGNIVNPTTPLATAKTNSAGTVVFESLTGASWYCFQTTYTGVPAGNLTPTQQDCTNLWGSLGVAFHF